MDALLALCLGFLLDSRSPTSAVQDVDPGSVDIRCPACGWQPGRTSRWSCNPGCLHYWNTFETRGVCPECSKRWHETACHRCGAWSPHDDWYVLGR